MSFSKTAPISQYLQGFCADPYQDKKTWNYIIGNIHFGRSIGVERREHLADLCRLNEDDLTIALHNHEQDAFTKWGSFWTQIGTLITAPDVHRSLLKNEIVIESDNPDYQANAEASRFIGAIIESKGFVPHYYYSGGKSIHIHVYFDWRCLLEMDEFMQQRILAQHSSKGMFQKKFIEWLRKTMISCWGTNARIFDSQLATGKHLIRSELSRNKKAYKTFLGYTYKDIPPFPIMANEETGLFPELGEIHLSRPIDIQVVVEEYLHSLDVAKNKAISRRKELALSLFLHPEQEGQIKGCAAFLLSDSFAQAKDGFQRAAYLLTNELRKAKGDATEALVLDWNIRMGSPCREQDLIYRCRQEKIYTISHEAIHGLLREAGFQDPDLICDTTTQPSA